MIGFIGNSFSAVFLCTTKMLSTFATNSELYVEGNEALTQVRELYPPSAGV